jgi:LysM repeat protein
MQLVSLKKNTLRTIVLLGVIVMLATGCFKSATEDRPQPTLGGSSAQEDDLLPVTATASPPSSAGSTPTEQMPGSSNATLPPIVQTTTALAATRSAGSTPEPTTEPGTPGPSPTPNPFQPTLAPTPTDSFIQATEESADTQTDTANPGDPCTHTIQAGENLFRIGLQYDVTTEELAAYNGITDVNSIYAGQVLRIPNCGAGSTGATSSTGSTGSTEVTGGAVTGGQPYTVQAGETLYALAARWGVDMQDILDANPDITDPDSVYAGQVINIP